jgi:ribosome-associated protein
MGHETPISKTRRKKESQELQELGAELLALSGERLAAIDLPEFLHDAVLAARRITSFEARRRQLQYIGKLMRTVDPGPIRERLARFNSASRTQTARLHLIEGWRTRLIEDENALTELLGEYPDADAARLLTLVKNTLHERELGQPPKSFRALFRLLDETLVDYTSPP